MQKKRVLLIVFLVLSQGVSEARESQTSVSGNSMRMPFVAIKPGSFTLGADLSAHYITAEKGIFIQDELPARQVTLTYGFEMSCLEITNAQYEQYDPDHAAMRGKAWRLSAQDNEAVVYVNWTDALHLDGDRNQPQGNAFCLSDGTLMSFSDGSVTGASGSLANCSMDGGKTWAVRTTKDGPPGIHVGGVELSDSRLHYAFNLAWLIGK